MTEKISISNADKLSFFSNLATMLTAGIPILETVESLGEDAKGNIKKVLTAMQEDLIQGRHVYETFARFPNIFDKVTVNIIKASEEAGTLDVTLKDMKDQIKKDMEFADRIKSALMYPAFIVVIFFGVLLMILIVVIPKIASVFTRLNATLPLPTQMLIAASNVVVGYPIPFTVISATCIAGFILLYKKQKKTVLHMLFKLPLVSELIKQIDLTRFSRSLFLLLKSGIIITTALELTEQVVLRQDISESIRFSKEMVLAGRKLSEAFKERKNIFPGVVIKIIEAGERTGTLEKSLEDISGHLDYEVSNTLKTLTTVLEPLMLVVVGILVGSMMLAIMAPIYNLIGQVGPH